MCKVEFCLFLQLYVYREKTVAKKPKYFIYKMFNTMKNKFLISAFADLLKAYNANVCAHNLRDFCSEYYAEQDVSVEVKKRNFYYDKKINFIIKAIKKIKTFKLPIKYGTNNWITYFEYESKQVSYHTFSYCDSTWGKKFKWKRSWIRNEDFPFLFYLNKTKKC